ncbi:MAG: GNAT family N-acetyltransferase [Actinomycetales bacterium]
MVSFTLRPATVDDAGPMSRMHLASMRESYSHVLPPEWFDAHDARLPQEIERRRESMAEGRFPVLAVEDDGSVVGLARAVGRREPGQPAPLELTMIYVLRRVYGQGVGQALLDAAVGSAPAFLWVLEDNPRARAFYRRNGFVPDGTRALQPESWNNLPKIRMVRP